MVVFSSTAGKLVNSSLAQLAVISWCTLNGCCHSVVHSGWLLLFPGALWMVVVISWCTLDG